ncbi:MAG TPA: PilC/PilY family type IV pilus protein, partial [Burkholderiales bacterium]|nr:PilC/PilY family type IV pilus protein [Burkholderiales bacterium]
AALQLTLGTALAAPTDISQLPLDAKSQATPNLIFGVDDSGSMDSEIMLNNNDGALWWDANAGSFWNASGVTHFNTNGIAGASGSTTWYKYVYLFPNGTGSGNRTYSDATHDHFAVPPTPAYVFLRSADYNPLYYNFTTTYKPWQPGYISGSTRSFPNAPGNAARSHPWFPAGAVPTTMDLTQTLTATASNWTFRMLPGMVIPGATISGVQGRKNGGSYGPVATDYAIPAGETWDVAIPYLPASYWVKDPGCSAAWPACAAAPDGTKLRRYEIKPGVVFPSGRSYLAELQNFANWFTYYRKRRLMLAAGMGEALNAVKGLRGGSVYFNNLQSISMYDFAATADSANARALLGAIYANNGNGGTPTRETLKFIGEQDRTNAGIVQYGCQRNAAFVLTDGFANASNVTVPAYTQATYVGARPYQSIHAGSLADLASSYYTNNLRPDLPTGLLNVDPSDTSPAADKNPNLHMNTFGVTLGLTGTIYGTSSPAATNPYLNYPNWPAPTQNRHPSSIDDLWHATINGRGKMFLANNAADLTKHLREVVNSLLTKAGSDAGIAVSNVNLKNGDNTAYVSSYNAQTWTGQLAAFPVNVDTGQVDMSPAAQLWEARDRLTGRGPDDRVIVTYNGARGVAFQPGAMAGSQEALLATPGASPVDSADVIRYLRGERLLEGTRYRTRAALLGDIVSAEPVFVGGAAATYVDAGYDGFSSGIASRRKMIYQAANDGMLHAFDASNGDELWGYVPGSVYARLNALTNPLYSHQFMVDGTPTAGDVDVAYTLSGGRGAGDWRTLLVGGLGAGGPGFYALDVTQPNALSEVAAAGKVLWEFPNASTADGVAANVGVSYGKPVLAKTQAAGWVVLVTSGYNNTGDGRGHLFVLDARSGELIRDIRTEDGSSGLAQVSAWANNAMLDATIDYVYGGDLTGNVWRFNLSGATTGSWNVVKLATLTDPSGVAQPITAPPELAQVDGRRTVFVGTGALLGSSDIGSAQVQSMYGIVDDMTSDPLIASPRTALVNKTVTVAAGGIRNIDPARVDYSTARGWYFDLPGGGERVNTTPTAAFGVLVFSTNQPSLLACSSQSYLYAVDVASGGQLATQAFAVGETPWSGKSLGSSLASRPVIVVLPNGSVQSITHKSDTSLTTSRLPVSLSGKVKKVGWKEIFR